MNTPTFSIITPIEVHNQERKAQLMRAVESVNSQTYNVQGSRKGLFEHIVIDDGSQIPWELPNYPWLKRINQDRLERLIAANKGFKASKKNWFVLLDSDDALSPYYLEACAEMIKKNPNHKVFNFGSVHFSPDYTVNLRDPFKPPMLEKGHDIFSTGNIVKGTFIFHRECYETLGGFPEITNPWDFSKHACEKFPEIKPFFTVRDDEGKEVLKEMGNPMGDDYYLFYKLTRLYHSLPLDVYLYMVYHKGQRNLP